MAWHRAKVSNGPTEGMNNLLKRVKRVAFGFINFENLRIRALLYAGKPNFRVLDSIVVARRNRKSRICRGILLRAAEGPLARGGPSWTSMVAGEGFEPPTFGL